MCVGGATVSSVGTMKRRRKKEDWRWREKTGREGWTPRRRGGFGLPAARGSSRQQSVSGGPLVQSVQHLPEKHQAERDPDPPMVAS